MLGVLLVEKPVGITSHDVVNRVRRRFGTRRVGHAGTLDPLANGLLVVAVGSATRFLQYLPLEPKEYVAHVRFGRATSTYDREGAITREDPVPDDLDRRIADALPRFLGLIQQTPPAYSAIKVNGQPLYRLARSGQTVLPEPRTVHVGAFEPQSREEDVVTFRVECSGGTYVRSLAHDLGVAAGCGASLDGLVRTRVGRFTREMAHALDAVTPEDLIPLHQALPPMPLLTLTARQVEDVRFGRTLRMAEPPENFLVGLLDEDGRVVSVARVQEDVLQPECVIPAESADLHA